MDIIQHNRSLKDLNWLKVGGVAKNFAEPSSIDELKRVWSWALEKNLRLWVISGGSNVLIQDGEIDGLVISTHAMVGIETVEKTDADIADGEANAVNLTIRALAGTPKSEVAKVFLQNKLAPAIFLTGIPGDLGAGVVMNAGIGEQRTPREFCEIVHSVEVLRLKSDPIRPTDKVLRSDSQFNEIEIKAADIAWQYRHSSGWQPGLITRVELNWRFAPDAKVMDEVRAQTKKRVSSQPLNKPNCGSVFRNPAGQKSAQLIESCGLKGYRVGGASVSTKHSNFIVNEGAATARDVKSVIDHVHSTVLRERGVELRTEVVYIGEF